MKQDKGQSINDFLARMHSLRDQLALSEPELENAKDFAKFCTYRDNLRLMQFIMALHDDYEPVRASLLHREKFPTLESAVAELLSEETCIKIMKPKVENDNPNFVMAASSSSTKTEPSCRYYKQSDHLISKCPKLEAKNKKDKTYNRPFTHRFNTSGAIIDSPPPSITLNDLQDFINQMNGNASMSLLSTTPTPTPNPGSSEWSGNRDQP